MAFARCKVICSSRLERPITWNEDPETGQLATNSTKPGTAVMKSGPVMTCDPKFPKGRCIREFVFTGAYPQSGIAEDKHFFEATPQLEFKMTIHNAAVDFVPGRAYYLDFVRIVEGAEAED